MRDRAKVGNFVELKRTVLGAGSKAMHLAYLGDATIGENVNIGAGTITCNYDGVTKNQTVIEDGAFIGSDTQLIAPVTVGKGRLRRQRHDRPRRRARRGARGQRRQAAEHRRLGRRQEEARTGKRLGAQNSILTGIGDRQSCAGLLDTSDRRKSCRCSSTGCGGSEYRGYDSAGVAVVRNGAVDLRRSAGKLSNLEDVIDADPISGDYGVGHTRWATHGRPTEENAHPHRDCTGKIVVVHNGIIENYLDLKHELQQQGHKFVTETDTEIVAHLVEREMKDDGLENAVRRALLLMRGLFALVLISADDPEKIVAVRNGPPIVVGLGDGEFFVASDIPAILSHTRDVVFLGDEEMAIITRTGVEFTDFFGRPVSKATQRVLWDPIMAEKGGYKHFMLKEIFEQPTAARETILGRVSQDSGKVFLEEIKIDDAQLKAIERVTILACGTSWHAALVGKFMIEQIARLPVEVDYGSEYRYRRPIVTPNTLAIVITQSGETADTLAALREAKRQGARSIAICNVVGSMATRETDGTFTRTRVRKSASPRPRRSRRNWSRCTCWPAAGPGARHAVARRLEAACRCVAAAPAVAGRDVEARAGDGRDCGAVSHAHRLPVSRPRHQLSDRARRRAEAEGDFLHPCRGLSGRRDEARPDRAHRRTDARRHARAARSRLREDDRQHAGGQGARRLGHRAHDARELTSCGRFSTAPPMSSWSSRPRPRC